MKYNYKHINLLGRYLHGGADSGFRSVKPEEYTPRLFHFHGDKNGVTVKEVSIQRNCFKLSIYAKRMAIFTAMKRTALKINEIETGL